MKKIYFVLIFALLNGTALCAQDLTWNDAVKIAESNNADILSARSAVESSEAKYRGSFADFLPQISGSGGYSKSNSGGAGSITQENYSLSMSAQQSLFSGLRTKAAIDSARAQLNGAQANLQLVESQLVGDLRSAFISVLYAQENVALLKKIRDRRDENGKLIEFRFQGGRENRGSYLRSRAQFNQAQFEVEQAERTLHISRKILAQTAGQDGGIPDRVTGTFDVRIETATPDFAAMALQTPSYKKSESSFENARSALRQSQSEFFPDFSLSGSGRRSGKDFPPDSDSWSVGASVNYSFFTGGRNFFDARQAKSEIRRASSDLDKNRRHIEVSLENAFVDLQNAMGQADIQKKFLEAAEERAKIARAQYDNGLISFQDWDNIESDLISTQKQTLDSQKRAAAAESAWIQAQGKGLHSLP